MSDHDESEDLQRITKACEALSEHFDSVQIFASRHESGQEDGTINCQVGRGNWFTRYGHVRTWLVREDERSRQQMRKESE